MVEMMMVGVVTFPMHESAIRTEIDNINFHHRHFISYY